MRVLHIEAGRHLYGGPRQVLLLLDGLRAAGVSNTLVCPPGSAIAQAAVPGEVDPVRMRGEHDALMVLRLRAAIARHAPDIVHVHSRRGADWYGPLAARSAGVPVVLSRRVDNPETRWMASVRYAAVDRIVAISECIREMLLGAGVPPEKIACVRSAVPDDPVPPRDRAWLENELGIEPDAPLLGMVAQLIERKGHATLLDALPAIRQAHPRVRALLLGQGPLRHELQRRLAAASLDGTVVLAGFRADVGRILPNLDLLVHPATREGLGIAVLQAARAGVAIVASDAGGLPEIVADGKTGLLVPPGDAAALAEAVSRLLADAGLRARYGAAGARRVAADFAPRHMVAGNLRVYREVLARRGAAATI